MTQARTLVTFPSEVPKKASSKDPRDVTRRVPIEDPGGILREIPGDDLSKDPSNDPSRVPSMWCPQQGPPSHWHLILAWLHSSHLPSAWCVTGMHMGQEVVLPP